MSMQSNTCEYCGGVHDKSYGSGRFCSESCAKTYASTINKRTKNRHIISTFAAKPYQDKEPWNKGQSAQTDTRLAARSETIHKLYRQRKEHSKLHTPFGELPRSLKVEVIFAEQGGKCLKCGNSHWLGQLITLELEHRDGNTTNNGRDNLELLCPNCHSFTETWRGRSKNRGKSGKRVSDQDLLKALKTSPSIRQALLKVGLSPRGNNYLRARALRPVVV